MSENGMTVVPKGSIARQGFGSQELEQRQETAATAVAERAKAEVQALHIMAMQNPRSVDEARVRILEHCKRKRFAEAARYAKPIGRDKVEGASIRFVESALQEWGNVSTDCTVLYDDDEKRIVRVRVTDLERNISHPKDVTVYKTVERKFLKKGQQPISSRVNSYGDTVHLIEATEDDVATKQGALESKALRTLGLRILPRDIVDEAMDQAKKTALAEIEQDPGAARKRISDAFQGIGVYPKQLGEYLGHELGSASPAELEDLRLVFGAISDGEATWSQVLELKHGPAEEDGKTSKTAEIMQRRKAERDAKRGNGKKQQPNPNPQPGAGEE